MKTLTYVVLVVVLVIVALAIASVGTMLLWQWVVPDVFAGMVKAELLPATLTFAQALKIGIFIAIMFGGSKASSRK